MSPGTCPPRGKAARARRFRSGILDQVHQPRCVANQNARRLAPFRGRQGQAAGSEPVVRQCPNPAAHHEAEHKGAQGTGASPLNLAVPEPVSEHHPTSVTVPVTCVSGSSIRNNCSSSHSGVRTPAPPPAGPSGSDASASRWPPRAAHLPPSSPRRSAGWAPAEGAHQDAPPPTRRGQTPRMMMLKDARRPGALPAARSSPKWATAPVMWLTGVWKNPGPPC